MMTYQPRKFGAEASVAAFPLGGIGTGNISLGARGDLRDWEIFNAPNKGFRMPNTFFAIWAQSVENPAVCKVLEGPLPLPHNLSHGYHPWTAGGLPRLQNAVLRGEYPLAEIEFQDADLPVQVKLTAFTPFIPLEPDDSGLPCAILKYTVHNPSSAAVNLTIVGSLINPIGGIALDPFGNIASGGTGQNVNEIRDENDLRGIFLRSEKYAKDSLLYGNLSLATTHSKVTTKRGWLRGGWYDFLQEFWNDFSADGQLTDLGYETPSEEGRTDTASLGLYDTLQAGETRTYEFILSWFFPNRAKSWHKKPTAGTRNHYATLFDSSWEVARYFVENKNYLETETNKFHDTLFSSTLPSPVLDALSANIVPLRSPTCFWLEDGNFYAYEGCFDNWGSCDGNCTHVWSYAQTLAFLFPSLERNMRQTEFMIETDSEGYMFFRTYQPFGEIFVWGWADQKPEAAVDGQMGSILRVLREWRMSGDKEWLASVWDGVKRALHFAAAHWDTDNDGVLDGRQHNTYDIEFFGANPLCNIYYLAGLRAVEELANVMGEPELSREARTQFERSSQRMDEMLWNGEYYIQQLADVNAHKYQHGTGCLSDQLLGQLHARILDLGDLVPAEHSRAALQSIFKYNFKTDFRNHVNCQRTYVLNDESGLILASWPQKGKPTLPFVYSDEVWTGIEYQVAAHLIYEGFLDEGLRIVDAVQARHDGIKRNPWDEVECGHHYARSMSSWALLLAFSGYQYDAASGQIAFAPVINADHFSCFFSTGSGWGSFTQQLTDQHLSVSIHIQHGTLRLNQVHLSALNSLSCSASLNDKPLNAHVEHIGAKSIVVFDEPVECSEGQILKINIR
jgi:non-lysosomal glucosylceramidase